MNKLLHTLTLSFSLFLSGAGVLYAQDADCGPCNKAEKRRQEALEVTAYITNRSYNRCFTEYNGGNEQEANFITDANALYVCGCISDIMSDQTIPAANQKESHMAQKALSNIALDKKIENLKLKAKEMQHDFSALVDPSILSCDIDTHIQNKSSTCKHSQKIFTANAAASVPQSRTNFDDLDRPQVTTDDFMGFVLNQLMRRANDNAEKSGNDNISSADELLLHADAYDATLPLHQANALEFINANLSFSAPPERGSLRNANYNIKSARKFNRFIRQNYLKNLGTSGNFEMAMRDAFHPSRNLDENRKTHERAFPEILSIVAKENCQTLKENFDNICNADSSINAMAYMPDEVNEAYQDIDARYRSDEPIPKDDIYYPLRALVTLRGSKVTPTAVDISHMVVCEDKSKSLEMLYEDCDITKTDRERTPTELQACTAILDVGSRQCESYEALFRDDEEFRQTVISANIGILGTDNSLNDLINTHADDISGEIVCLQGNTPREDQFRYLVNDYLRGKIFSKTFAEDVESTEDYVKNTTSNNASTLGDDLGSGNTINYQQEENLVSLPSNHDVSEEVEAIIPTDIAAAATESSAQEIAGPYNPANFYTPPTTSEKEEAITSNSSVTENKTEPKIAALMNEIERLNKKLLENNKEIEDIDEKLEKPDLAAKQRKILEEERAALEQERKDLEKLKRKAADKIPSNVSTSLQSRADQSNENKFGIGANAKPTPTNEEEAQSQASSGGSGSGDFSTGGPISESSNGPQQERPNDLLELRESRLALASTEIDDVEVARAFLGTDNENTGIFFTTPNLSMPNPENLDQEYICTAKKDSNGIPIIKEKYSRGDYNCEIKEKSKSKLKIKASTQKKKVVAPEEIDPVTFEDAKKAIGSE